MRDERCVGGAGVRFHLAGFIAQRCKGCIQVVGQPLPAPVCVCNQCACAFGAVADQIRGRHRGFGVKQGQVAAQENLQFFEQL